MVALCMTHIYIQILDFAIRNDSYVLHPQTDIHVLWAPYGCIDVDLVQVTICYVMLTIHGSATSNRQLVRSSGIYQYLWYQHLPLSCFAEVLADDGLFAQAGVGGCSTLLPSRPRQCRTDPHCKASHVLQPPHTALSALCMHLVVEMIQ